MQQTKHIIFMIPTFQRIQFSGALDLVLELRDVDEVVIEERRSCRGYVLFSFEEAVEECFECVAIWEVEDNSTLV